MRICVVGGDERLRLLAELFRKQGYQTDTWGQGGEDDPEALPNAQAAVLPFPRAGQDGYIPAPWARTPITVSRAAGLMAPGTIVMAGKLDEELSQAAERKGWRLLLPSDDPDFEERNAMPSAEGAVYAAMQKAGYTICGSHCLIIGPGRIGKELTRMLLGLHAHVTVAGRNPEKLAAVAAMGARTILMEELPKAVWETDILFSTVPSPVAGEEVMATLPPHALAIDLASAPFGIDLNAAARHGITAWREGGIPGRYAPMTAARILFDYFLSHTRSDLT